MPWRPSPGSQPRFDADQKDDPRIRQVVYRQIVKGRPKGSERDDDAFGILSAGSHSHIEVFRGADQPVRRERVGTDDQELNALGVEFG